MLTLYFPQGDLKSQFYNDTSYVPGLSGREAHFSQAYVGLMFLFYRFLGWGICQITGGMENRWKQRGIVLPVASFSHLCGLFGSLDITAKQRYNRLAARFKRVEVQFSRIKHCIRDSLFTKRTASRKNKDTAIANLINIWNSFGKRKTMKIESLCH